ncbi:FGGY-family carbohydrate kinase [Spongiactinospora sp. TRM90649]|uniref:FGGY-family carbohydrate kinase n=1 Tax=Spongiactinospora sp. TRM90649 TaxID=3031114 RepID=UPI0023F7E6C9|nr:FGGY-family carbohydrate kinase [Spongiactinospora sp. TRM90649]MDF5757535.1 FGGY-family carbohydrate kinase [Spongiactinospora sp. TRM90649]
MATGGGEYAGAEAWAEGRAEPAAWLAAVVDAVRETGVRPAAICVGGQSPTTVPMDGSPAVTVLHPAGATLGFERQHYAQREFLGIDGVLQIYDWIMNRLGATIRQSRWPGDVTLNGYGRRAATGQVIGHTDGAFGLPADIPLVAGAQDAFFAFWAGGVDTPGRAMDPGGRTGGLAVAVECPQERGADAMRSAAIGVDIVGGPVSSHGLIMEWLAGLTGRPIPELLDRAALIPPGADGVRVLPYLEGERAPRWNRELRAEITGLGSGHGPGHIARAALEGTAYGLRHIAESLRVPGLDVLVCAGSPARSELWCQIKADVLDVPVEVPEETDLAAYGAALSAGAGAGWWPVPGDAKSGSWPRPAGRVVKPTPRQVYRDGYRRFVESGDAAERRLRQLEASK